MKYSCLKHLNEGNSNTGHCYCKKILIKQHANKQNKN